MVDFQIDLPYEALKSNPCNEAGRQGRSSEEGDRQDRFQQGRDRAAVRRMNSSISTPSRSQISELSRSKTARKFLSQTSS